MSSPNAPPSSSSNASSPSSSMSSDEFELSFDYELVDGELIRHSRRSSSKSPHSTPPTPPQDCSPPVPQPRRMSLSRSESLPSASESLCPPPRPLQRVISGPITLATPAASAKIPTPLSTGLQGTGRKLGSLAASAQRVQAERHQRLEEDEHYRRDAELLQRERLRMLQEEKENHGILEQRPSPPSGDRPSASLSVCYPTVRTPDSR